MRLFGRFSEVDKPPAERDNSLPPALFGGRPRGFAMSDYDD
jgi:hypothetical protein